ncbi:hypothetical protein FACS1894120_5890 [Clostridia bacterium]|nr:hypothetical protein FACS1894120_5890 [Clostridia bacterium]
MENRLKELIELVKHLPVCKHEEAINDLKEIQSNNDKKEEEKSVPPCPHCGGEYIVRFGFEHEHQRYKCKNCNRTFIERTETIMAYSHQDDAVWESVASDTANGVSIDKTAEALNLNHHTVFNMRHKILATLDANEKENPTVLTGVCEADETYVLDDYKGAKLPCEVTREPRKHGAVAQSKGISNEYIAICTATSRDGGAVALSVNRATPSSDEILEVFASRLNNESFLLCDGAKSYNALEQNGVCGVKGISNPKGTGFENINTTNGFHSFIKSRIRAARGIATKYQNRYNALFEKTYRNAKSAASDIWNIAKHNGTHFLDTKSLSSVGVLAI